VHFDSFHKEIKIEDLFSNAFRDYPELKETYDDVLIIHITICLLCSCPLFDENFMGVICNTIPRFLKLIFAHDEISNYQINSVYIPYVNMNNFFIDQFGTLIISMLIAF
jgi:hypothetical protein